MKIFLTPLVCLVAACNAGAESVVATITGKFATGNSDTLTVGATTLKYYPGSFSMNLTPGAPAGNLASSVSNPNPLGYFRLESACPSNNCSDSFAGQKFNLLATFGAPDIPGSQLQVQEATLSGAVGRTNNPAQLRHTSTLSFAFSGPGSFAFTTLDASATGTLIIQIASLDFSFTSIQDAIPRQSDYLSGTIAMSALTPVIDPVPEPSTLTLLGFGGAALALAARRRRQRA